MLKTKLLTLFSILPLITLSPQPASLVNLAPEPVIEQKQADERTKILQAYLAKYNSPLQNNAADFVEAADTYSIDWRLVAAISGVESTFGKRTPGGCNSWGWGVYGTKALKFNSCKDGIYTVSEGLKRNYIDKGLTEPLSMNRKYAASPTWGVKVNFFLRDMDKFEKAYRDKQTGIKEVDMKLPKFAMDYAMEYMYEDKQVDAKLSFLPEELSQ